MTKYWTGPIYQSVLRMAECWIAGRQNVDMERRGWNKGQIDTRILDRRIAKYWTG
jgi:hypothetical protein